MRMSHPEPKSQAHPPAWRRWLLLLASTAVILTLLALPRASQQGMVLSYSAGQVTGRLANGHHFATTIPVALDARALAGQLAAHHVQVTGVAAASSSPLSVLIGFLPLLLFGVLLLFVARGARRQVASLGGLTGTGGLTKAKTRGIDAERSATRFADLAGYPAVKTEIGEVVDYPRGPRGGLMVGPPGTGKTLLARAVARQGHLP